MRVLGHLSPKKPTTVLPELVDNPGVTLDLCRDRIGRLHWFVCLRSTTFPCHLPDDRLNIHRGEAEQRVFLQPLLGRSEHPVHRQTPVPRVFAGTFQFSSCLSPAFLRKSSPPVPASVSSGRRPTSVGCQHTWTHALHIGG